MTLKALVAELAEHGIATCPTSVWRLVRSEGMSFKNVWPAPSARGLIEVATDGSASTYTA
jgi:transposase